jgi:hypothetical protein
MYVSVSYSSQRPGKRVEKATIIADRLLIIQHNRNRKKHKILDPSRSKPPPPLSKLPHTYNKNAWSK